jgi:hypothetical protein
MKKDASIQGGTQPGSTLITGYGSNAGGPMVIQGMNITTGEIDCMMN